MRQHCLPKESPQAGRDTAPGPPHTWWSTSYRTLPAGTPRSCGAAAFHRIQHLRGKNEEMIPKSLLQNTLASSLPRHPAACHLFCGTPRTLLATALTCQR